MKTLSQTIIIVLCFISVKVNAQNWNPLGSGANTLVRALCDFNGKLFVGGDFISAGGTPCNRVATWDNNTWAKADSGISWTATNCFAIYNNELYAGGSLGFAKWDGLKWVSIGTGSPSGHVYIMTVYNNELYTSGASGNINKWDGSNWTSIGLANSDIYAMCVYNGELIVGGIFTDINSTPFNGIAKWNGSTWSSIGIGILGGYIHAMGTYNGELYAGGDFTISQGNSGNYIAKWNGINWSSVGSGLGGYVREIDSIGNKLYVGGGFGIAGGIIASNIATWDGNTWGTLGTGMNNISPHIFAITEFKGDIYAGGAFTIAGGNLAFHIARWGLLTGVSYPFSLNTNVNIFPNPFNQYTIFEFENPKNENHTLTIYDPQGRLVRKISDITTNKIEIDRQNLSSGLFFFQLKKDRQIIKTGKLAIE